MRIYQTLFLYFNFPLLGAQCFGPDDNGEIFSAQSATPAAA